MRYTKLIYSSLNEFRMSQLDSMLYIFSMNERGTSYLDMNLIKIQIYGMYELNQCVFWFGLTLKSKINLIRWKTFQLPIYVIKSKIPLSGIIWITVPCKERWEIRAERIPGRCHLARTAYDDLTWDLINTLRTRQNGRHFSTLLCIFFNDNVYIWIKISLKFIPKGPIN